MNKQLLDTLNAQAKKAITETDLATTMAQDFSERYGANIRLGMLEDSSYLFGSSSSMQPKEVIAALGIMNKELSRYSYEARITAKIHTYCLAHNLIGNTGQSVNGSYLRTSSRTILLDLNCLSQPTQFKVNLHHEFWHALMEETGYPKGFLEEYNKIKDMGYITWYAKAGGMDEDLAENWGHYMGEERSISYKTNLQLAYFGWILKSNSK